MEEFIVSARKYRPSSFSTLIGQDNIAATLKNSILNGQLAHAYLFCGPRGVGKTSSARIFAKTINCLHPTENMEPCGECESCISFQEGRSFSIHELDAASNNSVDDIRNLIEQVRIKPQIGKYSVFIIDEVHMLSASAFNAFLKTLEEPPSHAIFILATTEKHKILPTILSRCQVYDFNRITVPDIVRNLSDIAEKENIKIENDALHIIASKADGAMRDALTLFDQMVAFCGRDIKYADVIKNLNILDYEYYFRFIDFILESKHVECLLLLDEIIEKGFSPLIFMSGLSSHIRDLIVSKNQESARLLEVPEGLLQGYVQQAEKCSIPFLYNALSITTSAEAGYRQSSNKRLHMEFALIKLCMTASGDTAAMPATSNHPQARAATQAQPDGKYPNPQSRNIHDSSDRAANTAPTKETDAGGAGQCKSMQAGDGTQAAAEGIPTGARTNGTEPGNAPGPQPAFQKTGPAKMPQHGLSLKELSKLAEKKILATSQDTSDITGNDPVTVENLERAWMEMSAAERAPRLSSTLARNKPELAEDGTTVIFRVSNSVQKSWIEDNCLARLQNFLQRNLNNASVKLKIELKESEQSDDGARRLYMPNEKAKFMIEQNPELNELRKDLDLEIK